VKAVRRVVVGVCVVAMIVLGAWLYEVIRGTPQPVAIDVENPTSNVLEEVDDYDEEEVSVFAKDARRAASDVSLFIAPRHLPGSQELIECE
jgi:uncharacterized protein (UPF0333 family)